ncbi:hypothetical protein C2G38_2173349 [Gigaspora rosea]|uniref:Uncharacterized protein n=1 Tax=Gigaspora rosea TaxID=44941 RepID=A0A397VMX4_9GLOM|nr:hypothetical protein C2G38_2173349 [Gigaspora rosea]
MLDPLACVREETKIQQYFDFVPPEENENKQYEDEGTIEESINDNGAVDNDRADDDDNDSTSETIISSNYSNNCEEILRPPIKKYKLLRQIVAVEVETNGLKKN